MSIVSQIEQELRTTASSLGYAYPEGVQIEEAPAHIAAEYSSNLAMQLARSEKKNPKELVEQLAGALQGNALFEKIEVAMPGFLNVTLSQAAYTTLAVSPDKLSERLLLPEADRKKICVEYISANPSGPLHIGNARGGPLGETVARILAARGHTVEREFYLNDIGGQANKFAASVLHFYLEHFDIPSEFPEKGYPGAYVKELALEVVEKKGRYIAELAPDTRVEAMRIEVMDLQAAKIRATIDRMAITFDRWYPQSLLVEKGLPMATFKALEERGATFEKDGAMWLREGFQEDDRDSVLVKSDGTTGYFLDDIAYHREKFEERGFDIAVVALGANHSGHIPRMQAGIAALGFDPHRYQTVLYQYVQLKEDGETRKMAKREGTFVTADEVLDEIPCDVFTYFMLSKANETHLDFDMQLAKDTSEKNPIYYIQYAHARIQSILAKQPEASAGEYQYNEEERTLLRHLDRFVSIVSEISTSYRVHLLPTYLYELATRYHHFYAHHRVITDESAAMYARLGLSRMTAATLKAGLSLMNIEAQDHM